MIDLAVHLRDHVVLALGALGAALALGIPIGAVIAGRPHLRTAALGLVSIARIVPSLAVLAIMLPLVGIGFAPALVALLVLALAPIVIATDVALRSVPAEIRDAARGLGMTSAQIRRRIDWPLAVPILFTGIRTATVEVIASATLAAFIGGGGLGEYIVNGLAENDTSQLLIGATSVGLLALLASSGVDALERRVSARR